MSRYAHYRRVASERGREEDSSECSIAVDDAAEYDLCCARPISALSQDGKFACFERFKRKFSKVRLTEADDVAKLAAAKVANRLKVAKGFNAFTYVQCLMVCGEDVMLTRDDLRAIRQKQMADGVCVLLPIGKALPVKTEAKNPSFDAKLRALEEAVHQTPNDAGAIEALKAFRSVRSMRAFVQALCHLKFVRVTLRCEKDIEIVHQIIEKWMTSFTLFKRFLHFVPLLPLLIVNERAYDTWQIMKSMANQKKDLFGVKDALYKNCDEGDLVDDGTDGE